MTKNILSILVIVLTGICFTTTCDAGWLIFHKPEYRGRIIDAETKEPIEGAVVVAMYYVAPYISGPAGGNSKMIYAKEALTDEKGEFHIPSYTTLMSPNSYELEPDFIIYKPGYSSYPNNRKEIYPFRYCGPGILFSKQKMGTLGEIRRGSDVVTITYGVLELPRLKTREERIKAQPSGPSIDDFNKVPILDKLLREEYEYLYGRGKSK